MPRPQPRDDVPIEATWEDEDGLHAGLNPREQSEALIEMALNDEWLNAPPEYQHDDDITAFDPYERELFR